MPLLWSARKIRRVVKSTFAAETLAAVDAVEDGIYLSSIIQEAFRVNMPLHLFVDSKSLVDKLSSTHVTPPTEKRLVIDLALIKSAVENGDLNRIEWVPRALQLADALTKDNRQAGEALQKTINEGTMPVELDALKSVVAEENTMGVDDDSRKYSAPTTTCL